MRSGDGAGAPGEKAASDLTAGVPPILSNKTRVVFLTGSLNLGGTERNILHLATHLPPERFEVEVLSDYEGEPLQHELRARGIRCLALKGAPSLGRPLLVRLIRHNLPYQLRMFRELLRRRNAVIHSFGFPMAYYAVLLGRLAGCRKIIFTVQDWDVWKRSGVYCVLDRICSRLAARVVADGEGARRLAQRRQGMDPRKMETIYDGVNTDELIPRRSLAETRYSLGLKPGLVTIGMIARLEVAKKGQDLFLRAIPAIRQALPATQFLVVGDGPDLEKVERLAAALPTEARPAMPGGREDLADVLMAVDVLVIPSRWESVPKILLEAMWLERAVIATRVGDIPEILDDSCGVLVPSDSPDAIARAAVQLAGDAPLREHLGKAARRRIIERGLTLGDSVRAYERLYNRV